MSLQVSQKMRRNVLDWMSIEQMFWAGRLGDVEFLARLYDLTSMPSYDSRFASADEDIWQHRVNNDDWEDDWVFRDDRFNLMGCDDSQFLAFLAEMLHPVVRPDADEARRIAAAFNQLIAGSGFQIAETEDMGGYPVFSAVLGSISGFASVEDIPTPKPSGSQVPYVERDGYFLTPIELPFYEALRDTSFFFAVQPWIQGVDRRYRLDFLVFYDGGAVAVELDGHEYHKTKAQRQHDAQRDRWFLARGVRTMRWTGSEVAADPQRCVAELREALRGTHSRP
jgi:very-short-patch-repair endonuclease